VWLQPWGEVRWLKHAKTLINEVEPVSFLRLAWSLAATKQSLCPTYTERGEGRTYTQNVYRTGGGRTYTQNIYRTGGGRTYTQNIYRTGEREDIYTEQIQNRGREDIYTEHIQNRERE